MEETIEERAALLKSTPVIVPEEIPQNLTSTRKFSGVRWVAGIGKTPAKIMFLATSVLEEEEIDHIELGYIGKLMKDAPEYLKGGSGSVLRNLTASEGIPVDKNYYTAWVKWLAPKGLRLKPNANMMDAGRDLVLEEIRRQDPDIIVCMGNPVFDELNSTKISLKDAAGGWFHNHIAGKRRLLYPT